MELWKLEPDRTLGQPAMERFRSIRREGGLVASVLRLAWWAGMRPRPSETPFEFAEVIGEEVPTSRPYVRSIARAYVNERFGRRKLSVVDQIQLERAWGEVRRGLLRRMSDARQLWTRLRPRSRFRRP